MGEQPTTKLAVQGKTALRSRDRRKLGVDRGYSSQWIDAGMTIQTRVVTSMRLLKVPLTFFSRQLRFAQLALDLVRVCSAMSVFWPTGSVGIEARRQPCRLRLSDVGTG